MNESHRTIFVDVMNSMKQFWGQPPMSAHAIDIYWRELKCFSIGQLELGCQRLLGRYKLRWHGDFPTALDFYEAMPNYLPEGTTVPNGSKS